MPTALFFLLLLIALNAFFAASEIALISLNDNKIRLMAEEGHTKAKILQKLLSEPSRFLATIQIGITLAGFLASAFAAESFSGKLVGLLQQTGIPISANILNSIAVILITIILSYFTLVLGELVPKRLAMKRAEPLAMLVVRPLNFLAVIAAPFVTLLTISTNFFVRLFGVNPTEEDENVTEEEIRMMVDVGEEKGTIDKTERIMINNIFEFDNKFVSEIMTHRIDIIALSVYADLKDIITLVKTEKFSRIPVYEENIDNIIGILNTKDLIQFLGKDSKEIDFQLSSIIREAYYVPLSIRTDDLFTEMKSKKIQLAVVIDEYGGTAGIVTIEDLVEEIVGSILDEYDEDERDLEKINETTYIISGTVSLDTIKDYFDLELPVDDYETLSGFIIGQTGRIPHKGEKPEIVVEGLVFQVQDVDKKRITKVKVSRLENKV